MTIRGQTPRKVHAPREEHPELGEKFPASTIVAATIVVDLIRSALR